MKSIAILGGGIAGLTAANYLIDSGKFEVTVLEKSTQVGGRMQAVDIDGFKYDIGATLLTPYFMKFLEKTFSMKLDIVDVFWDVVATDKRVPLRIDTSLLALEDMEKITHEKWYEYLYSVILFAGYYHDMDKITVESFLKDIDINKELQVFLTAGVIDSGIASSMGEASILDLMKYAHHFKYPVGSTSAVPEAMAKRLQDKGGRVLLSADVGEIKAGKKNVSVVYNVQGSTVRESYDYVISAMGVNHTLDALKTKNKVIKEARKTLKTTRPTLQTTHFMYQYHGDPKESYTGRSPLNNYYPLDSIEEVNSNMVNTLNGKNKPFGFYSHFPALVDHSLIVDGVYPLNFMIVSSPDPSEDDINAFREFIEDQFSKYFLTDFKEKGKLIHVATPKSFINNYNDPGYTASVGPYLNHPTFPAKLTDRLYMAGAGVEVKLAPSVIQASASGLKVARMILELQ